MMNDQSAGYCPCCSKPIAWYRVIPETSVYEFMPCRCQSQTWTVQNGKFVGGSSTDRRIEHPQQPYWDAAKEAANRILSNKWDNNELASEISAQDARTVAAAFLEAIQW